MHLYFLISQVVYVQRSAALNKIWSVYYVFILEQELVIPTAIAVGSM
jgi:hypothetical protein